MAIRYQGPAAWPQLTISVEPKATDEDQYEEGFLDGYLRAYADGEEYACKIKTARKAFAKFMTEHGRGFPRRDVEGW